MGHLQILINSGPSEPLLNLSGGKKPKRKKEKKGGETKKREGEGVVVT